MHKKRPTVAAAGICGLFQPNPWIFSRIWVRSSYGRCAAQPRSPADWYLCLTAIPLSMYNKKKVALTHSGLALGPRDWSHLPSMAQRKREGGINYWAPLHRTRRGVCVCMCRAYWIWQCVFHHCASDLSDSIQCFPSVMVWVNVCVSVCVKVSVSACDRLNVIILAQVIVTVCVCEQHCVPLLVGSAQCEPFSLCARQCVCSRCPGLCVSSDGYFKYSEKWLSLCVCKGIPPPAAVRSCPPGRWDRSSWPGQLVLSWRRARSMFMRWPTRVTPSSTKSSLVSAGRCEPSISLSWNLSRCSARFKLSSQSPTSYLFQRERGFCRNGREVCMGCPEDGEGERLRALTLLTTKRTSLGSWGTERLEDFRMVGGVRV